MIFDSFSETRRQESPLKSFCPLSISWGLFLVSLWHAPSHHRMVKRSFDKPVALVSTVPPRVSLTLFLSFDKICLGKLNHFDKLFGHLKLYRFRKLTIFNFFKFMSSFKGLGLSNRSLFYVFQHKPRRQQ